MSLVSNVHPFSNAPEGRSDPIFGLLQTYLADTRPNKVNLGIGMYYDEHGALPVLKSVRKSMRMLNEKSVAPDYLPMGGYAAYCREAQRLLFGNDESDSRCVTTIQTLGGSGALRIGAEALKRLCTDGQIWICSPGWDNHAAIFSSVGLAVQFYPYLAPDSRQIDFDAMVACFDNLRSNSIILLHTCCHNPSGIDLSHAQWEVLVRLFKKNRLIPFLDFAYQGFGEGIDEDAWPIRLLSESAIPFLVASSFSKNFGLYNQRCGVLSAFCANPLETERMRGLLNEIVRSSYSNPPAYGAHIIAQILSNEPLRELWKEELDRMRSRIVLMRQRLIKALTDSHPQYAEDYEDLDSCRGMFITTGLKRNQTRWLQNEYGIYLIENGRLCLAGLNDGNIDLVAEAIGQATTLVPN